MALWQTAVLVRLIAVAIVVYGSRKAMARTTRTHTLFGQFALAALWTNVVAIWLGEWSLSLLTFISVGVGLLNGAANFFMWNANAISTSRNGFFTAFDDVAAMALMMLFVPGAAAAVSYSTSLGMALCVVSAVALAWVNYRKIKCGGEGAIAPVFYVYAIGYALSWGIAIFCIGYFAIQQVGVWRFISGWYLGASIATLSIMMLDRSGYVPRPTNLETPKTSIFIREVVTISIANSSALVLQYTAFAAVSLVILQPAFLIMDIVVPLIIGIMVFGEKKQFSKADVVLYGAGALGFFLIVFGR